MFVHTTLLTRSSFASVANLFQKSANAFRLKGGMQCPLRLGAAKPALRKRSAPSRGEA
jgi:hypothetical protein